MIRHTRVRQDSRHIFRESPLAHLYCQGNGLEIGAAAHNPFGLPGALNVAIDDENDFEFFKAHQIDYCGCFAEADLWRAAGGPIPVEDASQDYVLSSHVLEHIPDAIKELIEWDRVLRDCGIVFIIVPKRHALLSDTGRPVTSTEEIRKGNKDRLDSGKRDWKIKSTADSKGAYANPVEWAMTAADVTAGGAESYCDNVRIWAQATLEALKDSGNI